MVFFPRNMTDVTVHWPLSFTKAALQHPAGREQSATGRTFKQPRLESNMARDAVDFMLWKMKSLTEGRNDKKREYE